MPYVPGLGAMTLAKAQFLDGCVIPGSSSSGGGGDANLRAVHFNGLNAALTRILALNGGVTNGPLGTISYWIKTTAEPWVFQNLAAVNGNNLPDGSGNQPIQVNAFDPSTNPHACVYLSDAAGTTNKVEGQTTTPALNDGNWHHVIHSWDTNHANGSRLFQTAVDGVLETVTFPTTDAGAAFSVDYTDPGYMIGGSGYTGTVPIDLHAFDLCELYFNTVAKVDLSVGANLLKFRTAGGKPANLGPTGGTPTGTPPTLYLSKSASTLAADFAIDKSGNGNNFLIQGNLVLATTDPF